MMARVVMAMVDRRHAIVEHGDEVEWVRSRRCWGAILVVQRDLGEGNDGRGGTI